MTDQKELALVHLAMRVLRSGHYTARSFPDHSNLEILETRGLVKCIGYSIALDNAPADSEPLSVLEAPELLSASTWEPTARLRNGAMAVLSEFSDAPADRPGSGNLLRAFTFQSGDKVLWLNPYGGANRIGFVQRRATAEDQRLRPDLNLVDSYLINVGRDEFVAGWDAGQWCKGSCLLLLQREVVHAR